MKHEFLTGHVMPYFSKRIFEGKKPDFVILDTAHTISGEILDFLYLLPYVEDGCVFVLHDISLNLARPVDISDIATNLLFNSVCAEKYLNLEITSRKWNYPNIGAFEVNEDTRKYVENVFGVLTVNWGVIPPKEDMKLYKKCFKEFYSEFCNELFDRTYKINLCSRTEFNKRIRKAAKIMIRGRL